jgi:hypothetical protein
MHMNTPNTKHELATRLNALAALKSKLETLSFSEEERDVLTELLSQEEGREARRWRRARAEQAVNLLFPTWRGGRIEKPQHPQWHENSWWWNGASIESLEECANGDLELELSSYVGRGETDTIHGFILKKEWLDADDMDSVIKAYCEATARRLEARRTSEELARARAEAATAQARLARLQGR